MMAAAMGEDDDFMEAMNLGGVGGGPRGGGGGKKKSTRAGRKR